MLTLTAGRSKPAGLTETFTGHRITPISVFTTTLIFTTDSVVAGRTRCTNTTATAQYYLPPDTSEHTPPIMLKAWAL